MNLFFDVLKGQVTTLNFILLLLFIAFFFWRKNRIKASRLTLFFCMLFFFANSTGYLPIYLVGKMESSYPPFVKSDHPFKGDTIYVHALGGGYVADEKLEANSQLSWPSLSRLTEAIRISRLYKQGMLVLSGPTTSGKESLAAVERRAAIQLGFDSTRIILLEFPSTTQQEAAAFRTQIGKRAPVIVVTDAIHMRRAIRFFCEEELNPVPAPTNYLIKKDHHSFSLTWMPSAENFLLMDRWYREWLGTLKGSILGSWSCYLSGYPIVISFID